jgi:hypothetical protein
MIAAASSDGRSWSSPAISSGRPIGEERRAPFGPELAERFHRELAVRSTEEREGRVAIFLAELGEDLREVGGMLLVQEIDEVRRRADPDQAPDESRTTSILRCAMSDPLNLPCD